MTTIKETLSNGHAIEYKEFNGTFYHAETVQSVVNVLYNALKTRQRIIVDYGDAITGESWNEKYDIAGYVGRSTGKIKIPLLVHNSRSMGGGGILDHCIIKITTSKGGQVLYQHPLYHTVNNNL